jgi:hypothetical protein
MHVGGKLMVPLGIVSAMMAMWSAVSAANLAAIVTTTNTDFDACGSRRRSRG